MKGQHTHTHHNPKVLIPRAACESNRATCAFNSSVRSAAALQFSDLPRARRVEAERSSTNETRRDACGASHLFLQEVEGTHLSKLHMDAIHVHHPQHTWADWLRPAGVQCLGDHVSSTKKISNSFSVAGHAPNSLSLSLSPHLHCPLVVVLCPLSRRCWDAAPHAQGAQSLLLLPCVCAQWQAPVASRGGRGRETLTWRTKPCKSIEPANQTKRTSKRTTITGA